MLKAKGKDVPMPVKRWALKAKANKKYAREFEGGVSQRINEYNRGASTHDLSDNCCKARLNPGTKLAARFPHLVKAAAPT